MSTDFSLEDVLHFMEQEEVGGEFMDDYKPAAKIESDKVTEVTPPASKEPEVIEDDDDNIVDDDHVEKVIEDEEEVTEVIDDEDEGGAEIPKSYFEFLEKQGLLAVPEGFEFDGTANGLQEAMLKTKENLYATAIQEIWNRLDPDFQAALKYNLDGGKDFSKFSATYGANTLDLDKINLSDTDSQKAVVREYYKKTSKYSDEKINRLINRLIEMEDLTDEAEEAVDYLKKSAAEEKQQILKQQEEDKAKREQEINEWRSTVVSNIQESDIPKSRKGKIQAYVLNPVQRGEQTLTDFERTLTAIFSNPEHYIQLADMIFDYDPKKGLDTSRTSTKTKSQAASSFQKELEDAMKSSGKPTTGVQPRKAPKEAVLDWENILAQLDK